MTSMLAKAASRFGAACKAKLSGPGAAGAPEEQLRAPLETLLAELAAIALFRPGEVVAVGETTLSALQTRPDYAVTVRGALVGFIELKAPGKGADPRRFRDGHDRGQWERLRSLPNLVYADGNQFSLWRGGAPVGEVVHMEGDVETAGAALRAPAALERLFADFLRWKPAAPTSARALAETSAKLCRLLRDEAAEQLAAGAASLCGLARDWRWLLFPEATDAEFADGYAQAVTFGLLVARAQGIPLAGGLDHVARSLGTSTVIGGAFRVLTDDEDALRTSLGTLTRVLGAVGWAAISKGDPDAWLYFYEDFLTVYDPELRRQTGSYYTPPEVVTAMTRLVDEALRHPARFAVEGGLSSADVTLADPAMGAGTFLLGALRRIAETTRAEQGGGAVPGAVRAALPRLIGFKLQFGPFAVAQLRLLAEVADLLRAKGAAVVPGAGLRLFVTDTLGNPYAEEEHIPRMLAPLADSRRQANAVKRAEPITVVLGNPPYKEKAKGRGGWVEAGGANDPAPLGRWMPPAEWGVGAHAKHLRNLCVCVLLALGDLEGVRRRGSGPRGGRVLHHGGRVPERPRVPGDARRPAPGGGRDLGGGLLAGRAPAPGAVPRLPGGAAAGVHRAGGALRTRRGRAGAGAAPRAARGAAGSEVRGAGGAGAGRRRVGGLSGGGACAVPAGGVGRLGGASGAGQAVHL